MKKAFTLVELLIVIAVLVILMTMLFRLSAVGSDSEARNQTINSMQRLEFALSGYHAAFGSYPPVRFHNSRNIYLTVDEHGMQNNDASENTSIWGWYTESYGHGIGTTAEQEAWRQVEAACRAQPVACEFPFSPEYRLLVESASQMRQSQVEQSPDDFDESSRNVFSAGFDDGVSQNPGRHSPYRNKMDWRDIQLFRFGLLSYLLPRYLIMMNGDRTFFEDYNQWTGNNSLPADPLTGRSFQNWTTVQNWALKDSSTDLAHIANIPSQAVCARWMPTFERSLACYHSIRLFGVELQSGAWCQSMNPAYINANDVHSPGGYDHASTSGQYILDKVTLRDGWGHDLYYYSPPPYQSYTVWSAGKNGRTFPPWISRTDLGSDANKCVSAWTEDDLVNLSN